MNQYLDSMNNIGQEYGNAAANIASTVASNHLSGLMNEETNKEIYKQGVHALNGMIGESAAESALMLGHMGYNSYKKYKQLKNSGQKLEPIQEERNIAPKPETTKLAENPVTTKAPAVADVRPEPESSGIASGTIEPKMVTSSAQTDTPVMKLKGGGLLDEGGRYRYDPNVPGMIRKPKSEGGTITNPNQDLIDADARREQYLREQSAGARARASRRLGEGADPDDVDLPPAGFKPPIIKFANEPFEQRAEATDLSIRPKKFSSRQTALEEEQRASLERYNVGQARMKQRLAERADPDIQVGKYRRGGYTVESGGRSGYNPLDTPQTRLQKQVAEPIATQTEPEPIAELKPAQAVVKETPVFKAETKIQDTDTPATGTRATPKLSTAEPKPNEPKIGEGEGEAPKLAPTAEGGGLGLGELVGGGMALGQLAKGNVKGAGENLGLLAGTEAAESAIPGLGEVLMAGTAIGSLISDLVEKSKDSPPKPPPTPAAPTMAFASASPLDSTSYRAPMGGIGT
jgi:hypothetical protein